MKITNYTTQAVTEVPDDQISGWLSEYAPLTTTEEGFIIYEGPRDFAFYHPRLGNTTNTEHVVVEVPNLEAAQGLLDVAQQMAPVVLGLLGVMQKSRLEHE